MLTGAGRTEDHSPSKRSSFPGLLAPQHSQALRLLVVSWPRNESSLISTTPPRDKRELTPPPPDLPAFSSGLGLVTRQVLVVATVPGDPS